MVSLNERTSSILETAVRDFIETGNPITSEGLFSAYDFGIKPAMIRRELGNLAEAGYLYQTHPSGGRFPTDRAYEFYVSRARAKAEAARAKAPRPLAEELRAGEMQGFVDGISAYLNAWALGRRAGEVYVSHLSELLPHLGISDADELVDIVRDLESLPARIRASRALPAVPVVFIGRNPFTQNEHLSVIAGSLPDGECSIFVVGPKRMDYEKSLRLLCSLGDLM